MFFALCATVAIVVLTPLAGRAAPPELTPAEKAFAQQMSGATLVGSFTTGPNTPAKAERYDLGEVRKVAPDRWLIEARIRYGDNDVTLPLTLPVKFAGDTAVIIVNKMGFQPLGVYSARVLIHDGRYAGYWDGAGYGGHLFGTISLPKAGPATAEPVTPPAESAEDR
ncbi:MAG: hypothetical protein AAGJ46_02120 [Planctomycetota bacterium]